jgi:D-alanyl-D-alanine carboxypeptidase
LLSGLWPADGSAKGASVCKLKKKSSDITAYSVYAVDYSNRKVIMSRRPRARLQPASTTKLLTALVVIDRMDLDDRVRIGNAAVRVEPTRAGLTKGATYTVRDLLRVLLATSANDAGVALAVAVAGSEKAFADLMNKKARALGAKDSFFINSTGLPDPRQLTTAYDLSIITRAAFSCAFVKETMRRKTVTIAGSDGKKITRRNHNKFLWELSKPEFLLKTGFTRASRHCYAGVAYYEDRRVSIVILKSRSPWADLRKIVQMAGR